MSQRGNGNSFFSQIRQISQTVGQVLRDVAPIWNQQGQLPQPSPPQPTYQGPNIGTTGNQIPASVAIPPVTAFDLKPYMPLIIGGGALLALVFAFKK